MAKPYLRLGTRRSRLALWQSRHIARLLTERWPRVNCALVEFSTQGDRRLDQPLPEIGGKGLFTAELERALLRGEIDLAVHSLKDLPTEDVAGLHLAALTSRADVRDVLISRHPGGLDDLPHGAIVGTSSTRRAAQLRAYRSDLIIRSIRGNVGTRVQKIFDGAYDAGVLALAGLQRLRLTAVISEILPLDVMLPAPGQGALAVQCRIDDERVNAFIRMLDDPAVRQAVTAERQFLRRLEGGCSAPIAAYATVVNGLISASGWVGTSSGTRSLQAQALGFEGGQVGNVLAEKILTAGGREVLDGE